jgi:hypothetical protein
MRLFGFEEFIGEELTDVALDRDYKGKSDVVTLTFGNGRILQFWAAPQTNAEDGPHAELQFHVEGYDGLTWVEDEA